MVWVGLAKKGELLLSHPVGVVNSGSANRPGCCMHPRCLPAAFEMSRSPAEGPLCILNVCKARRTEIGPLDLCSNIRLNFARYNYAGVMVSRSNEAPSHRANDQTAGLRVSHPRAKHHKLAPELADWFSSVQLCPLIDCIVANWITRNWFSVLFRLKRNAWNSVENRDPAP